MQFLLDILAKIGFDWHMALFNLINFLIVFWILKRLAFDPVMKIIDERQQKMRDGIDNYQKSKTELQMAERKAQEIIDEAKSEGNKLVERAHDAAKDTAGQMKEKARAEISMLVEQAKKNIEIDRQEMREQLRRDTVALVAEAAEKIIGEKIDTQKDEAYITSIIEASA
ncbi:MAG: ATP synthase F0 subunit B [Candidatus Magasanikbacteria bacterium CG10_big_fil_rev_8_21_14_0_10_47_10]|uniref:ATP synthase subunit b n=1 Tax=Candidatus Magasanikbacteria bacterium CG10_big_fil_rev_8_21_14_0_10_47_10 TaxID=1974652 RepID=A0A2H0TQD1_9BACT|nr:MAG: ATP synthase F0 subunit B [Candidatus Magasanikbacteria bacterium CG10_big_fil_rev_8_21_14_0_10_47_10]